MCYIKLVNILWHNYIPFAGFLRGRGLEPIAKILHETGWLCIHPVLVSSCMVLQVPSCSSFHWADMFTLCTHWAPDLDHRQVEPNHFSCSSAISSAPWSLAISILQDTFWSWIAQQNLNGVDQHLPGRTKKKHRMASLFLVILFITDFWYFCLMPKS